MVLCGEIINDLDFEVQFPSLLIKIELIKKKRFNIHTEIALFNRSTSLCRWCVHVGGNRLFPSCFRPRNQSEIWCKTSILQWGILHVNKNLGRQASFPKRDWQWLGSGPTETLNGSRTKIFSILLILLQDKHYYALCLVSLLSLDKYSSVLLSATTAVSACCLLFLFVVLYDCH